MYRMVKNIGTESIINKAKTETNAILEYFFKMTT